MELFRLYGSILLDNKEALKQLDITEKQAKSSQKAFKDLGEGAADLGKKVVAGATVAAGALLGLGVKAINAASDINDASKRVGMSAEEYQKWAYAAKISGVETDKLEALMKKQQTTFANATEGNKAASEAYQKLGINIKGLTSGDAFNKAISALASMQDETARNALANDLFGKSYADLAPLLAEGAGGIDALKQEAADLGMVMSNDTVAAGDNLGDTIDKLKGAFMGIVNTLGASLFPYIQQLADKILENKDVIAGYITSAVDVLTNSIIWLSQNLNWIIPILAGVVGGFIAFQIVSFVSGLMTTFTAITTGASGAMAIFNAIMAANPIGLVALAIAGLIAIGVALWMNWDTIVLKLQDLWKGFKDIFGKIGSFVSDIFNGMISGIKGTINGIIRALNGMINGMNRLRWTAPSWVPVIGGKSWGISIPNIPELASGGIAFDDSIVKVGEYPNARTNPEVIAPLDKLKDMIGSGQSITVNFYPQSMTDAELDNAFNYINRRLGMEV